MSESPTKAPKKEKAKRQTPEQRMENLRYNHMLYGPTAGEMRPVPKKVDFGASYLKHPKFQSLMTAFAKGTAFQFSVTDKGKTYTISTDGTHLFFEGKVIYYSRPSNRYECNLLIDRSNALQFQAIDAFVHLAIAVPRSFPELGPVLLNVKNGEFFYGPDKLEASIAEQGTNLLLGTFRNGVAKEKPRS